MLATVMRITKEPVSLSGWYEHTDGTVGYYIHSSPGRVRHVHTVAGWQDVPSNEALNAFDTEPRMRSPRERELVQTLKFIN